MELPEGEEAGRIFDRNNEADIDITDNADMVFNLYARKQNTYFVNTVYPAIPVSSLRHDLMDRARRMTRANTEHHPWLDMTDEEMLRSCGLILEDPETNQEGITLAAILLFGTDTRIMSVLPQHKTDAIFRVYNVDRYDDREVVITNLLESYDRLMAFGQKHLNDIFTLDGVQRISARDAILREIISNLLMHRDFSSGYVAKLIIERDRIYTENANLAHGHGNLNLKTFKPFAKNPPIAKVFREIGLADELGSGMHNSYKYTKLYSGGEPVFTEGDIFTITIPLTAAATATVGPVNREISSATPQAAPQDTPQVTPQDTPQAGPQVRQGRSQNQAVPSTVRLGTPQDTPQVTPQAAPQDTPQATPQVGPRRGDPRIAELIDFCSTPRSKREMMAFMGLTDRKNFQKRYLRPLLEAGKLEMTIPDKPSSGNQKYRKK